MSLGDGAATRGDRHYSHGAIAFHWTIAALVILNFVLIFGHEWADWASVPTHKAIGITILVLSVGRLAWRLTHRPPPLPPMKAWEVGAAHALHWLFYLLIIAIPLSGWWMSSASAKPRPLTWFGLFDIPYLPVTRGPDGAGAIASGFHEYAGLLLLALILLHVAAALRHHYILRDTVLARMAPGVRPRG